MDRTNLHFSLTRYERETENWRKIRCEKHTSHYTIPSKWILIFIWPVKDIGQPANCLVTNCEYALSWVLSEPSEPYKVLIKLEEAVNDSLMDVCVYIDSSSLHILWCSMSIGAEAPHPWSSGRFPVCGVMWDWPHCLRLRLPDPCPQPVTVRMARLLPLWPTPSRRHRKAQGAALHCREQQYRYKVAMCHTNKQRSMSPLRNITCALFAL